MSCPYPYEDGEDATLWNEGQCTARTEHRCYECRATIRPKERCAWASMLWDGRWFRMYRCLDCAALAELVATIHQECPLWGGLAESADAADISFREWHRKAKEATASA